MSDRSLARRPLDWFFVVAFASFSLSTFTVDLWAVTGRMHGDDPLARAFKPYAAFDPLFGAMPPEVWVLMLLSLVFFGPMDVLLVRAFVRGDDRIRTPALVVAGAQIAAMTTYFGLEIFGHTPPTNWPIVAAANLPYLLVPMALIARFRRERPFAPVERRAMESRAVAAA